MGNEITTAAESLIKLGFSVIPTKADKAPAVNWKPYQAKIMPASEVASRFGNAPCLAIVAGAVSGNLECLDVDDPALFETFLAMLRMRCPGLVERLCLRKTPNGYHILYRSTQPVAGNQKLAMSAQGKVRIETRGEGGYFLHAPSPGYEVIQKSLRKCPVLKPDEIHAIHEVARMFDKRQPTNSAHGNRRGGEPGASDSTERPGDLFNREHTAAEILERHGWKFAKQTTGGMGYTRPGKKAGVSGVVMEQTGNFYCWSSNAHPLEAEKSYSPFSLYAIYEHGGRGFPGSCA